MVLYTTKDSENIINKSKVKVKEIIINIKQGVSIVSPTILLSSNEVSSVMSSNYCFLEHFNRYYFIRDIRVDKNVISLELECDVLESFKDEILQSKAEITREMKVGDYLDVQPYTETTQTSTLYEGTVTLEKEGYMILSTLGGSENDN